jgi:hypothetical protein
MVFIYSSLYFFPLLHSEHHRKGIESQGLVVRSEREALLIKTMCYFITFIIY